MNKVLFCMVAGLAAASAVYADGDTRVEAITLPENAVWLEDLDLSAMVQQWGEAKKGKSVVNMSLTLGGKTYAHGVGSHANSEFFLDLKGDAVRFEATVGVDDETREGGSVVFEVWVDDELTASTGVLRGGDKPKRLSVDLSGAKHLALIALDGGDGITHDHADWADALLVLKPGAETRPEPLTFRDEPPPSIIHATPPEPAIHGPRIVGATPGRPFLFLIPATGEGPLRYAARGLPAGLELGPETGIIHGTLQGEGTTVAALSVTGPAGTAMRELTIVGGEHTLALTPPMGWNSWYSCGVSVNEEMVRDAADWMVKSGLASHGYQYVCIDDCWGDGRAEDGTVKLVPKKFKDMKALADHVHAKGLKFGIYTSPGPKTCAGYEGSFGHELQDAQTFAAWGVDFLKYDWCSYGQIAKEQTLEEFQAPYRVMREALDQVDRDIVYSLCQYGMGDVWKWGAEVGGNLWRTTGDIGYLGEESNWRNVADIGFSHDGRGHYAGPGHWNDPDMLMITGKAGGDEAVEMRLTPNEQIAHFSLWTLIAAPLILSCDLSQLDPFTLAVLANDEVIDVNQDPLGKAAVRRARTCWTEVWSRPLWDGGVAVGLFNRGPVRTDVTARWVDLGLNGKRPVRDLWLQKDLGAFDETFAASVPPHGAVLVRIGPADN